METFIRRFSNLSFPQLMSVFKDNFGFEPTGRIRKKLKSCYHYIVSRDDKDEKQFNHFLIQLEKELKGKLN